MAHVWVGVGAFYVMSNKLVLNMFHEHEFWCEKDRMIFGETCGVYVRTYVHRCIPKAMHTPVNVLYTVRLTVVVWGTYVAQACTKPVP